MKGKIFIVFLLILSLLLASCSLFHSDPTPPKTETPPDEEGAPPNTDEGTSPDDPAPAGKEDNFVFSGAYTHLPEVPPYTDRLPDALKIYRSMLTVAQQSAYDLMLPYALTYTDFSIDITDLEKIGFSIDDMFAGGRAINQDYPETWIYWAAQYKDLGSIQQPDGTYKPAYFSFGSRFWGLDIQKGYDQAETKAHIEELLFRADDIIARMPTDLSTKEKYRWIADYVCDITVYPPTTDDRNTFYADGPILRGKGICQGYAYAYQLLCQKAGLWCILCSGGAHAWNVVLLDDGLTYYMDLTWQDSSMAEGYFYFMTYEKCIDTGHTIEEGEWIANGK